jgi:GNAT superfamily N-acetyltransferase
VQIVLKTAVTEDDVNAVRTPLLAFNATASGRSPGYFPFAFHLIDDADGVVGGATGHGSLDWVFLQLLFVPPALRGRGIGSELLAKVEEFARTHELIGVWLDTFSFQARPFYERHGYSVVGTIDDYPVGGRLFFMTKRLDRSQSTH